MRKNSMPAALANSLNEEETKQKQFNIRGTEDDRKALGDIAKRLGGNFNMSMVVREFAQSNRDKDRETLLRIVMGQIGRQGDEFSVRLPMHDRERLAAISEQLGYEPQHLAEDVLRALLRSPELISDVLMGRIQAQVERPSPAKGRKATGTSTER